jgi:hypothetical protein
MELKDQSDHVALLSLMLVGVLTKRLTETGQLDQATTEQIHRLVEGVRIHARHAGLSDLNVLFDNVELALLKHKEEAENPLKWPSVPHH